MTEAMVLTYSSDEIPQDMDSFKSSLKILGPKFCFHNSSTNVAPHPPASSEAFLNCLTRGFFDNKD
jgi:hypothetical protein